MVALQEEKETPSSHGGLVDARLVVLNYWQAVYFSLLLPFPAALS